MSSWQDRLVYLSSTQKTPAKARRIVSGWHLRSLEITWLKLEDTPVMFTNPPPETLAVGDGTDF